MSSGEDSPEKDAPKALEPPAFSPSRKMCADYLAKRKSEAKGMLDSVRGGAWKQVLHMANHVRGTGAMYGFPGIGEAADALAKAMKNGHSDSSGCLDAYVRAVDESSV